MIRCAPNSAFLCRNNNLKLARLRNATSSRRIRFQDDLVTGFQWVKFVSGTDSRGLDGLNKGSDSVRPLLVIILSYQLVELAQENALYYFSRTMTPMNYSPIEKLCLALVFAIQKSKHYFQALRLVSKPKKILTRISNHRTSRLKSYWQVK